MTVLPLDAYMKNDDKSPNIDVLLRSMGVLKKQLGAEVRSLDAGKRGPGQDVEQLMELLRSEGETLEELIARRRGMSEEDLEFDLAELTDMSRCFICEEPVTAAQWHPNPEKIRCSMCKDD